MARGFLYVYERIYKGETEMQTEFRKIPVNGKRTSVADQKRVRKIISDNGRFEIAYWNRRRHQRS